MAQEKQNKIAAIEQGLSGEWKAVGGEQFLSIKMPPITGEWGEILVSRSPTFTDSYFIKYEINFVSDSEYSLNTIGMTDAHRFRYKISLDGDKLIVLFSPSFGIYQTQEYHRLR